MKAMLAFWFGLLGAGFFIVTTIVAGLLFPGYSHSTQLISESYALGTSYGPQLRYFGFIPSGIFIALFALLAGSTLPGSTLKHSGFLGIGIFYGLATILASVYPCDEGCESALANPSLSQLIHNLTGLLTYLVVPISIIFLGIAARKWEHGKTVSITGMLCGVTAVFFTLILSDDLQSGFAGLYQRIIEGSILAWIIVCSLYLRKFDNHLQPQVLNNRN
jgi:hypothetical protein